MSLVSMVLKRHRLGAFAAVGALGFLLQIATLRALMTLAHWTWLPATVVAVELTVVHNFLWHERWTWRDRSLSGERFVRYNATTGAISIVGNAALMDVLVGALGMNPIVANAMVVGVMAVANFVVADRWVFRIVAAGALVMMSVRTEAGARIGPANQPETVAAWNRYVAETEARLAVTGSPAVRAGDLIVASGDSIDVPAGTISDWRGRVFIPGVTLERLLDILQHPGTPPPQEDVVSSRVLSRGDDSLSVAIGLVRRTIVTVSYETEHDMQFQRRTPTLATARSVATRIEEVGGSDHGFLWRLNAYWRYQELDGGVLVELESLTLSRGVPSLVRPIATPLVNRIARESMVRTLDALRRYLQTR